MEKSARQPVEPLQARRHKLIREPAHISYLATRRQALPPVLTIRRSRCFDQRQRNSAGLTNLCWRARSSNLGTVKPSSLAA